MPVPKRDLELTRKRLVEWFATKLPDAKRLRMSELSGPGTTGFSNDTLLFDLDWQQNDREQHRELVVRLEPSGLRVFPKYDLGRQFRVMQILGETDVPVPRVFWREEDSAVLGAPFYIMERIEGRIPSDSPPYHAEGWVTELRPDEREAIWWSGIEVLARIHRLDWRALGFGFLDQPALGATPLEQRLTDSERYLEWAAEGRKHPLIESGLAWLRANQPAEGREPGFCWGDSRLGNMIFREQRCVAVLDWEMVTLGDPDEDLAWWLFFDRHHSEGCGVPRLPGFPSREETIARYQRWSGRTVRRVGYYEVMAAVRFAIIMIRVARALINYGLLPEDSDFESNNVCTSMLAQMLERPPSDG